MEIAQGTVDRSCVVYIMVAEIESATQAGKRGGVVASGVMSWVDRGRDQRRALP
jgi:hypothetical protein